ncbi:hypothetical protein KBC75_04120 [Candidatus Shapirobacteria bacterium]|nr:hypothetical protein [Candidatus Shapirobacteria bacterium]
MFPDIFRFNGIISIPMFALATTYFWNRAVGFDHKNRPISETILWLKNPIDRVLYRLSFVFKSLLDVGFIWWLLDRYKIGFGSVVSMILFGSLVLYGLLAIFVKKNDSSTTHWLIAFSSGILWIAGQVFLVIIINNLVLNFLACFYVLLTTRQVLVMMMANNVKSTSQVTFFWCLYIWTAIITFGNW